MIFNFLTNIFVSGSLNAIWSLIETQQMIVMLPLFDVSMPGNTRDFFAQIMQIAAFDYYDFSDIIYNVFKIFPTEPINTAFEALGFESNYVLVNIGSLMVPWLI